VPVGQLTEAIARQIAHLGRVAVEGEVSGLKQAASGHLYFSLKDNDARLDCKLWQSRARKALNFRLEDGVKVVCHGRLDVYAPRGTYSLIVERIERRGLGELLARLEELKADLAGRGWFERARPWPALPTRIGVVTSRDADGWRDFLRTRSKRWPLYPLRLVHTRVQGPGAAREIASAIDRLDASGVDVICVVRGGGSLEDLWAFNELPVAEAIWRASVPVITGVGHETDTTLADLVSDHRAHTPTDAAQTVLPDRGRLEQQLERAGSYLVEAMERQLSRRTERLERLLAKRTLRRADWLLEQRLDATRAAGQRLMTAGARRIEAAGAALDRRGGRLERQSPARRLARLEARLAGLGPRLLPVGRAPLEERERRLALLERALSAVSPLAVLGRGYSITRRADGSAVRGVENLAPGERLETLVAGGSLLSDVVELRPGEDDSP
jgi:exodeoxyribonuclease VII large subunit